MTRISPFPAWTGNGATEWLLPLSSSNSHLQGGKFGDLSITSLRPARDSAQRPIVVPSHDGRIRGLVRINEKWRHIDVTARFGMGAIVELAERYGHRTIGTRRFRVQCVRALRLRTLLSDYTPWAPPGTPPEEAIDAWDAMLARAFKRAPPQYLAKNNPWLWWHSLEGA